MTHTNNPTEQQAELRRKIEHALSVDWAFGTKHGEIAKEFNGSKPDKIIVQGYPKGAYHTSYDKFIGELIEFFTNELEKRELKLVSQITTDKGDAYYQSIPLWRYREQLEAKLKETPS